MIKIIIVDDNPPVLRSLKRKLEKYSSAINVVGVALNGREAQILAEKHLPDIIITDIKMPVMDGLELISCLNKTKIETHFIIISGFGEFEYARQALKLGAIDYLLKPFNDNQLYNTLDTIIPKIEKQKYNYQILAWKYLLYDNRNPEYNSSYFGAVYFCPIIISVGYKPLVSSDYNETDFNIYSKIIDLNINAYDLSVWKIDLINQNEVIIVIASNQSDFLWKDEIVKKYFAEVMKYDIPVDLCVGRVISDLTIFSTEIQLVREHLYSNQIFGHSSVFHLNNDAEIEISQAEYFAETESLLKYLAKRQPFDLVKKISKSLFLKMKERNSSKKMIESVLSQIVALLGKEYNNAKFQYFNIRDVSDLVRNSSGYESLYCNFIEYISDFYATSNIQNDGTCIKLAYQLKTILDNNYNTQISIEQIASDMGVNSSYLGKVYKKEFTISPMEYLTLIRIDKAKELLSTQPDLMIKDISDIIGYSNQYYFSKIFKLVTGASPSEFRANSN